MIRRTKLVILSGHGARHFILFSQNAIDSAAGIGTAVGTATLSGVFTGTAVWSLANDAGGKYAINSSTGAVTVAAGLTAGTDTIVISVSGVTPTVANATCPIVVTAHVAGGTVPTFELLGF